MPYRVVKCLLTIRNNAQRGEKQVVVGRNGHSSFQGRLRRAQFAAPNINRAEVGKRVKVIWIIGQNLLILFFCSLKIALLKVLPSRSDETLDFRWYSGLGLIGPVRSRIAPAARSSVCIWIRSAHRIRRRFFFKDKARFKQAGVLV